MQVRNNEITVKRGETFTLSKLIQNRDGSPYIVSSELLNPYWLLTVSSARYEQGDRYILNKWLDLKDFLRFYHTRPIELKSINSNYTFENTNVPVGYEGDETSGYANIAIFYEKDGKGVTSYKYWEYINNIEGNYDGQWVSYTCPIITSFSKIVTSEWIERNYYYQISLVNGTSTLDYLLNIAKELGVDVEELNEEFERVEKLYNTILEINAELVKNVDITKPLIYIDIDYPILNNTKLYVTSDLNGGAV